MSKRSEEYERKFLKEIRVTGGAYWPGGELNAEGKPGLYPPFTMKNEHAADFYRAVGKAVFRSNARAPYEEFRHKMLHTFWLLHNSAESLMKQLAGSEKERKDAAIMSVVHYFYTISDESKSLKKQLDSHELHAEKVKSLLDSKKSRIGDYTLAYELGEHSEAPTALILRNQDGKVIGSVGGYFHRLDKKPSLTITNIQGGIKLPRRKKGETSKNYRKRIEVAYGETYGKLNEQLGESWRVFLLRKWKEYADRNNLKLTGTISWAVKDKPERKQQQDQYRDTYQKAGLVEETGGIFVPTAHKGTDEQKESRKLLKTPKTTKR